MTVKSNSEVVNPEVIPENPPWTMFFEGPLYQKYDEFMRAKDFSQILLSSKLKLANMYNQEPEVQSKEQNDWDQDGTHDTTMETYQHVPIDYHVLTPEERKRRTHRTRAFILIAILIMAALALGTALVIHYAIIPTENRTHEDPIGHVNISFNHENKTDTLLGTDEVESQLNVLEKNVIAKGATPRDRGQAINPHSRIFPDSFYITTSSTITTQMKNTSVKSAAIKTKVRTSTAYVRKTSKLHPTTTDTLTTTQSSPTPTMDPFEFFAQDMKTAASFQSQNSTHSSSTFSTDGNVVPVNDVTKKVPTLSNSNKVSARVTTTVSGRKNGLSTTMSSEIRSSITNAAAALVTTPRPLLAQTLTATTSVNHHATFEKKTPGTSQATTSSEIWEFFTDTEALITTSEPLRVSESTHKPTSDQKTDSTINQTSNRTITEQPSGSRSILTTPTKAAALPTTSQLLPAHKSTMTNALIHQTTFNKTTSVNIHSATSSESWSSYTDSLSTLKPTISQITDFTYIQTTPKSIITTPSASSTGRLTLPTTTVAAKHQVNLTVTTEPVKQNVTSTPVITNGNQRQTDGLVLSKQNSPVTESNVEVTTNLPSLAVDTTKIVQSIVTGVTTESNKERLVSTTALPDNYNSVHMEDITTYTFETSEIQCQVKYAINWTSLSIQAKAEFRPLTVTLDSSGSITWSQQTSRHDVTYDIIDNGKGLGDDVIIRLILKETQCTDGNTFMCYLKSPLKEDQTHSIMVVVGKPDGKVKLTLGPAVVEDRALRITASWKGGFPVPWTNMSWMAIDMDNKTYDLSVYGQYTDYELTKDDRKCQTFMQHSIVIFPRLHLNATTVIVRPNLSMKKYFVDKVMEEYLSTVKPGVERILVIPLSYCPSNAKDMSIPHPYTPCNKFVRCHSGDLAVQLCPTGTCFYEPTGECVSIYR